MMVGLPSTAPSPTDVVLVKTSPDDIVQGAWYRMPLLGLGYLAAYLRAQGLSVAIVDALFDRLTFSDSLDRVAAHRPRLVGITAMTHEIRRAAQVARALRERLPDTRFVVGGPHATALPRQTLEEFPEFDYAVFGEGEQTLHELALALQSAAPDLSAIQGLVHRAPDGAIRVNEPRPWMEDLDRLPLPAWDFYGRSDVYQVYASRGCPFPCIFCMRVLGDRVRFRSVQNVVDEFERVVTQYHPAEIDFSDETFTMRRAWALEICNELIRRGLHKKVKWFANGRVNTVDEELLRRMREAGCVRIGFGIESGNQEILQRAQKGTTLDQIRTAIAAAKRAGLQTEAFYILGFPGETRQTIADTIRFAAQLNTTTAAFGIMVPYPGTKIAEMAARGEGGYRVLSRDWADFDKHLGNALELESLSRRDLERLQARAYLTFYTRNLRFRDLTRFLWEKRKAITRLARKIFGSPLRASNIELRAPQFSPRAYVVSQFPEFCETFILNEMVELGKRGFPFQILSLKRCRDAQFQPLARDLMERATVYPPSPLSPAHLLAHLAIFFRRPAAYLQCLSLLLESLRGPGHVFLKTLYVFHLAPWMARQIERLALRHVHAHWASIPSTAGLFIARMAGVPYSFTGHAYDLFIDRTLLDRKIAAARYVVTCTNYNRSYLLSQYPSTPPDKIRVAYHGVDLNVFNEPHDPAREEPVLLSVGRLCDTKGFPDLIEACRILKERGLSFECRIVGDGTMRRELEEQMAAAHLNGAVRITGLLPRDQVLNHYRKARLFVLPCVVTPRGDRDGLPNVLVEAMAMGLPAIGTDISALGEGIAHGETGLLVPPHSPQALADAIERLWNDPETRRAMSEKARARVREQFGLQENIDSLAAFLREQHRDG